MQFCKIRSNGKKISLPKVIKRLFESFSINILPADMKLKSFMSKILTNKKERIICNIPTNKLTEILSK